MIKVKTEGNSRKKESTLKKDSREVKQNVKVQKSTRPVDNSKTKKCNEDLKATGKLVKRTLNKQLITDKPEKLNKAILCGNIQEPTSEKDHKLKDGHQVTKWTLEIDDNPLKLEDENCEVDERETVGQEDETQEEDRAMDELLDVIELVRSDDLESLSEGFENFGPEKSRKLCVESDRRGLSPLTLAAEMNRIEVVKLMIEQRPNLDVPNGVGGWTALHSASSQGHVEMVQLLVSAGARVEVEDREGWTALHFSIDLGSLEVVKILVAAGADVNSATSEQYTPLYLACQSGHIDVVSWLLEREVMLDRSDKDGWTALHVACSKNDESVVKLLLNKTLNLKDFVNARTSDGITPLYLAAQHGFSQLAKLLISSGAEVNCPEEEGFSPLHVACQGGHYQVVKVILESPDSDVNLVAKTNTAWYPIHFATQNNHAEVVELLIDNGSTIDVLSSDGHTPLHLSAGCGNLECLKVLISRGHANPTVTDHMGWCPLHHASQNGHLEIIRQLIESQKQTEDRSLRDDEAIKNFVDLKTKDGDTSLLIAVLNNHISIAEFLIECGASVNVEHSVEKSNEEEIGPPDEFLSVLHAACEVGNPSMIQMLVNHGAKVDVKDGKGWSPLHCLAESGNIDCIDSLLANFLFTLKHSNLSKKESGSSSSEVQTKDVSEDMSSNDGDKTPSPVFPSPYISSIPRMVETQISTSIPLTSEEDRELYKHVLDAQTSDGHTLLFVAAHCGQLDTVKHLLKLGARTDIVDYLGWSPLHAASAKGHTEVVQALLSSSGLDVNRRTYHGFTSLYLTIQERRTKTAEYLLSEALADPNLSENQGSCPLHVAAQNGMADTIESLMVSGALSNKTDSSGWTALHFAVQDGDPITVRKLIEHGSDVDAQTNAGVTPLFIAVHKNFDEIIDFLLQHGARTDLFETETGLTPLHLACDSGYVKVVQRLLTAGANTEAQTKYDNVRPLYMATRSKHISDETVLETIVRSLLSEGAEPMPPITSGLSALHIAAQKGLTGVVQALAEHGAEVDALDEAGWTPLMFASRCGKGKTVRALLAAGAKPDNLKDECKNSEKVDALLLAVQNGHIDVVEALILWSCNINARTGFGTTALYCASQHGDLEMLQMLLFNGADPNLQDRNGFIPLHPACLNGHKKVAESLVKAGSSVDHQAKDGSRPIQLADRNGHDEIVEWLLTEGAKNPEYEDKLGVTKLMSGWGAYIKNVLVKAYKHGMEEYVRLSGEDDENDTGKSNEKDGRSDNLQREAAVEKMSVGSGKWKGRQKSATVQTGTRQVHKV